MKSIRRDQSASKNSFDQKAIAKCEVVLNPEKRLVLRRRSVAPSSSALSRSAASAELVAGRTLPSCCRCIGAACRRKSWSDFDRRTWPSFSQLDTSYAADLVSAVGRQTFREIHDFSFSSVRATV